MIATVTIVRIQEWQLRKKRNENSMQQEFLHVYMYIRVYIQTYLMALKIVIAALYPTMSLKSTFSDLSPIYLS